MSAQLEPALSHLRGRDRHPVSQGSSTHRVRPNVEETVAASRSTKGRLFSAAHSAWTVGVWLPVGNCPRSERNLGSPPVRHSRITEDLKVGRR
jgi:hypothetical protein